MTATLAVLPPETALARLRQDELAELFAGLPAATTEALSGHTWRGRALQWWLNQLQSPATQRALLENHHHF